MKAKPNYPEILVQLTCGGAESALAAFKGSLGGAFENCLRTNAFDSAAFEASTGPCEVTGFRCGREQRTFWIEIAQVTKVIIYFFFIV